MANWFKATAGVCLGLTAGLSVSGAEAAAPSIEPGRGWELMVDEAALEHCARATLRMNPLLPREVALTTDAPWEGSTSAYFSVIQDGDSVRLYYRGSVVAKDSSEEQVTCVAESTDGIRFVRPRLGLIAVNGSSDNNVVWKGSESHNFMPFIDRNPACRPEERYKALGGIKSPAKNWKSGNTPGGLFAFVSADGLHWRKIQADPVLTKGTFDSLNVVFWDDNRRSYVCYCRAFLDGVRSIVWSVSPDFIHWSEPKPNAYSPREPLEHFYTNATVLCPDTDRLYLAFPMRFVPERKLLPEAMNPGVSDAMIMSSHDGVNWLRPFRTAWLRAGLDRRNWSDRNQMPAVGFARTQGGEEWSFYISEHYQWPDSRLRRYVIPRGRLASLNAGAEEAEVITRSFVCPTGSLKLNYATSAAGYLRVAIENSDGSAIPGYAATDAEEKFGDELDAHVVWDGGRQAGALAGRKVRLRFLLRDADLFAFRFGPAR